MSVIFDLGRRFFSGQTRDHRVLRAALVSLLSRGVSIFGSFATIPLVVAYLGPDGYGLWTTLSSLVVWLGLADGGVSVGLVAQVSQAFGADDMRRIRIVLSCAFAVTAVSCLLLLLATATLDWIYWEKAIGVHDVAMQAAASDIAAIVLIFTAIGFPASVARQARFGMQEGASISAWDIVATVLSIVGQLLAVAFHLGIVGVTIAIVATRHIVNIILSVHFFAGRGRGLRPDWRFVDWPTIRSLIGSGGAFSALLVSQALAVQMDQLIVAKLVGFAAVADYSIVQKFLTLPQMIVTLVVVAQFPAYGEALARGDHSWIKRHLITSFAGASAFAVVACGALGASIDLVLQLWIGSAIHPTRSLVWAMTVYGVISAMANVLTTFFLAMTSYRYVVLAHLAMVVINLPLALYLVPRMGPAGAVIAMTAGYVVALIGPSLWLLPRVFSDMPSPSRRMMAT